MNCERCARPRPPPLSSGESLLGEITHCWRINDASCQLTQRVNALGAALRSVLGLADSREPSDAPSQMTRRTAQAIYDMYFPIAGHSCDHQNKRRFAPDVPCPCASWCVCWTAEGICHEETCQKERVTR